MRVYLAYAIDQATDEHQKKSSLDLEHLRLTLQLTAGISWVFDPGQAFSVGKHSEPEPGLREINQYALATSDLVVAYLPAGVPTVGVPMEIDRAEALGKKVLVVSDAKSWMLQFGSPNVKVVEGVREVQEALDGFLPHQASSEAREALPVVVEEGAVLPQRKYERDAGLDLVVSQTVDIPPNQFVDIHCGVSVQLPEWSWGLITGRSSTLRKRGLMVNQGVIDEGYRGELFAGVWNLTDSTVRVNKGERIAQLIVLENSTRTLYPMVTDHLNGSERGANGFGSTGV